MRTHNVLVWRYTASPDSALRNFTQVPHSLQDPYATMCTFTTPTFRCGHRRDSSTEHCQAAATSGSYCQMPVQRFMTVDWRTCDACSQSQTQDSQPQSHSYRQRKRMIDSEVESWLTVPRLYVAVRCLVQNSFCDWSTSLHYRVYRDLKGC